MKDKVEYERRRQAVLEEAAAALADLLDQLEGVGMYVPGTDESGWDDLRVLSFKRADEISAAVREFELDVTFYDKALVEYEKNGQRAVMEMVMADRPDLRWKTCEPCETMSPLWMLPDGKEICCVCGSLREENDNEKE